jgi:hypothetical protein
MATTTSNRPGDNEGYRKYLSSKQLDQMRLILFSKAAEAMGKRVEELKKDTGSDHSQAIAAIRSEWVLKD